MSVSFSRTVRALHSMNSRSLRAGIIITAGVLALWCWWFVAAEVSVYESAGEAWIEVSDAAHRTSAPLTGRVVEANLEIGRWVEHGEPLVILAGLGTAEQFSREVERREGAEKGLTVLEAIRKETEEGADAARLGDGKRIERARADLQVAVADARLASAEVERARRLYGEGLVSEADLEKARARLDQTKAVVLSLEAGVLQVESEIRQAKSDRSRALAEIDSRIAVLEAEEGIADHGAAELAAELEERIIKAPISGWLGQVSTCKPGSVLMEGDLVAVVIPDGDLKITARFPAGSGLGRIKSGQAARMRLHAFSWVRFGQVEAEVLRVGQEAVNGFLSVECRLLSDLRHGVTLKHGMRGGLVVEVDRMSPFDLLLTVVGRPWGRPEGEDVGALRNGDRRSSDVF